MKKMRKVLALLLSTLFVVSSATSCAVIEKVVENVQNLITRPQDSETPESSSPEEEEEESSSSVEENSSSSVEENSSSSEEENSSSSEEENSSSSEDENSSSSTDGPDGEDRYSYRPVISKEMPAIRINTADGKNDWATKYGRYDKLQDRIEYVDASITVNNCEEGYEMTDVEAEVKVRGNYTLEYSKKPIRIKLGKKNNMLGLHDGEKYKNWVLLADWKDLSMSNNSVAFYLGNTILGSDGYYCTDFRNVEVYLNGQYWGVYLLVEQQEAKDGRTSVPEVEDDYTGNDIGYLFEYDGYYTDEQRMPNGAGDPTFEMKNGGGRNGHKGYTIKSDIYADSQVTFLRNYMDNVYTIITEAKKNNFYTFNEDKTAIVRTDKYTSAKEAISAVVDMQSLVDTYILNEVACDLDVDWSSFYLSLNMTAEGNKLLTFEAPWDFDSCFGIVNGVCNDAQGMYAMNKGNPWFTLFKNVDWFNDMVCEKWTELKEYKVFETALEIVALEKTTYKDYYTKNYEKWAERLRGNGEVISQLNRYNDAKTAQGLASDYLTEWLTKRVAYLDSQWLKVKPDDGDNGNKPVVGSTTRYEAEKATWVDSPDVAEGNEIRAEENANASGGAGVAYFQAAGATLTFKFNVEAAVKGGAIELGVAPATMTSEGETSIINDLTAEGLAASASFTLNGKEITFTGTVAGNTEMNYWGVGEMLATADFVAGENVFVITSKGSAINIDYIDVVLPAEEVVTPPTGEAVRFEAENGVLTTGEGVAEDSAIRAEANENISGGSGVAYFQGVGNSITITITAKKAGKVTIALCLANATMSTEGETSVIGDLTAEAFNQSVSITMNGKAVTFAGETIPGNSEMNYWGVGTFTAEVELVEGANTFVITSTGTPYNFDYVDVYGDVE